MSSNLIILAIFATSLATYVSRLLGAFTSEKVSSTSETFQWFNCVAYATLAALLGRMIIFPAGVLEQSDLTIRIIVLAACIFIYKLSKENLNLLDFSFILYISSSCFESCIWNSTNFSLSVKFSYLRTLSKSIFDEVA